MTFVHCENLIKPKKLVQRLKWCNGSRKWYNVITRI